MTATKRTRVSNEQILTAISDQTQAISALISVLEGRERPATTPSETTTTAPEPTSTPVVSEASVDSEYLEVMHNKAQEHALAKHANVVLYKRRNKAGEVKLAYALEDRFNSNVKHQSSCLGAVETFEG